ncbi:MAG: riboflavin biosynthesis protein RibF [Planctomycetia bacterium]|nr:riboflavin biosynthesis protein RibF [Planctomycetia bacterium]
MDPESGFRVTSATSAPVQHLSAPIVFAPEGTTPLTACVVAVGNFDGVHVGHAAIAARLRAAAARLGVPGVVLTFDPHPASVLRPERAPTPLTTPRRRAELLLALGVDAVQVQPADAALLALEAEAFYGDVLRGRLRAQGIVEGADFRFGARRTGDVRLLETLCRRDGVELEVVPPVVVDGEPVSSSRLRALIAAGRVRDANTLTTAAYRLSGTVVTGARRGSGIGFPTANLAGITTLLPANGVYAARAHVAGEPFAAAVHVGPNVSFGESAISVEAHLVGFRGDLYGQSLDVDFLDRVRETRRFDTVDDLKAQLAIDVAAATGIVAEAAEPHRNA